MGPLLRGVTEGPRWGEVLASLLGPGPVDPREESSVVHMLSDVTTSLLAAEAVADVMPREWLLAARGPWLTAFGPAGEVPGPEWASSPAVLEAVTRLLRPLDAQQPGGHRNSTQAQQRGQGHWLRRVPRRGPQAHGWALVGDAGCPWRGTLDRLPAWGPLLTGIVAPGQPVELAPLPELQEWATCLTAALTHRQRLSASEARAFVLPMAGLLPGLDRLLDEPLCDAS